MITLPGSWCFSGGAQESNKSRRAPGGQARTVPGTCPHPGDGNPSRRTRTPPARELCVVYSRETVDQVLPEQLRRASEREALLEELSSEAKVPWTFTKVAEELGGESVSRFFQRSAG